MASLALFCEKSTGISQTAGQAFGIDTDINLFRVNSVFTVTGTVKAYAMVQGTILLQQQTGVPDKVNLILRPHDQSNFKLPIKYIVYRGLETISFIDNNDLSDTNNKVKTSGSELLVKMQTIQQGRAPGEVIPVQALFGNELAPAGSKNIDEFFFKNLAPASQLFTIDCGMELGNFLAGEIAIEIILENPEYYLTVIDAKEPLHEISISGISNAPEKKWKQDLVRHFVDPAAYYGLHHDIAGGIEYRTSSGKQEAKTPAVVFEQIVDKFLTKSKVYLDVRNENGYSYNYYGNYVGTGADANKNIKVGQTTAPATFVPQEYYTNGWAIHAIDITSGSGSENEIFVSLRVNDNEKPLLAGWNYPLSTSSTTGSIVTDGNVSFADEKVLLGNPIPPALPDFGNAISFKVPTTGGSTPTQLSTIVRLEYIKQFRENDGPTDKFLRNNPIDFMFGTLSSPIPWDSEDRVQWFGNNYNKYFDGWLTQGFLQIQHVFQINSININVNTITLNGLVADMFPLVSNTTEKVLISTSGILIVLLLSNKTENTANNTTTITVSGAYDMNNSNNQYTLANLGLNPGDNVYCLNVFRVTVNFDLQELNVDYFDLSRFNANQATQQQIAFYFNINTTATQHKYSTITQNGTGSTIVIDANTPMEKDGIAFIGDCGIVSETDTGTVDGDSVLFYIFPKNYYQKAGVSDTKFFNYKGGKSDNSSLIDYLKKRNPRAEILRSSINLTAGTRYLLSFNSSLYIRNEGFMILAMKKSEFQQLESLTNPSSPPNQSDFSTYHIKIFKLISPTTISRDNDGEIYFEYKLVVAGLDKDGNYKETDNNQAITVYSKDGQLFSSSDYAQNISASGANFLINFRRRSDFTKKGGHYGFDWMRPEYIAETDITNARTPLTLSGRGGICVPQNNIISKEEAQDQLKQLYTPLVINGNNYYVPWLSMYENHETVIANGNTVVPEKDEVRLSLELDSRSTSNIGTVRFEAPQGIEIICRNKKGTIITPPINLGDISTTTITVKCTQHSSIDRKLFAYDENNNLVGALNIRKNNEKFNLPLRLVRVNFTGIIHYTMSVAVFGNVGYNFNFNTNKCTFNYPIPVNGNLTNTVNLKLNLTNWVNRVQNEQSTINSSFRQALFDYQLESNVIDLTVDFGNYNANNPPTTINNGTDRIKSAIKTDPIAVLDLNSLEPILNTDYSTLIQGLVEVLIENNYTTAGFVTVFLLPIDCKDGLLLNNGYAPDPGLFGKVVVLSVMPDKKEIAYLVTHEVSHSLDLLHSFVVPNEEDPERAFMQFHTDNIMDYIDKSASNNKYHLKTKDSFWQWQIDKLHNSNQDFKI